MFRKAAVLCLVTGLVALAAVFSVTTAPADPPPSHVPDEVIIKFKSNASEQEKNQIRTELGGSKVKGWGRIQAELRKIDPELGVDEAIARYKNHPKVEYIEPNYIIEALEIPNDPSFSQLWGMQNTGQTGGTAGADISATNAWDVFTGSGNVLIGVIDTGVDYLHPDLAANIYTNPNEIPGNGIDDDNNGFIDDVRGWDFVNNDNDPMDDNGHGSHCSGTIGGVGNNGIGVAGVCWTVKILPLKFLSAGGSGSTAGAIDAVEYATMMGVNLTSNSWGGGGFSQALYDAISEANDNGILFVAAAGNSGANTDVSAHYPSSYALPNIISVAATDHNDNLASFSNYGATSVDLAAPGVDILSTFPGNTYGSISGTSMATPHVSGALGLVFGRFPAIGHLDAKNLILNFADPLPNLSGVVATGGRLNAFFPIADPDSIAPGMIDDAIIVEAGSNWLTVQWTAPGDDGDTGTASRYVVKYSLSPINDGNFDAATTVADPPDPDPAGSSQSMEIHGLDFDTTYYVAIKALDEFGNAGPASNSPSGTTLGVPDIAYTPTSLSEVLLSGASATQAITLSNVGFGTLEFDIPVPDLVTLPPLQAAYAEIGKGEVDVRAGDPVVQGTGGPDGFGYRWVDSDEPFGPAFVWNDIAGTGTVAIASGDDTNTGPFPIGFAFSYYGVEYTSFRVCSNGFMSFTSTANAYSNQPLPNAGAPFNMIAPFWDDLNVASGGTVYYESDGTTLTVQWNAVPHYGSGGPYTFQAVLSDDGTIEFKYLTMGSPDNSATVGIQNASGTDALQVAFNTAYIHDNLAVRIVAVPQWVTVTPTEGIIYAPNSMQLNVEFDAGSLLGGTYDGNIRILSNDPDEETVTVPVQLSVIGAPDISVMPASHDFGQVFIGATPAMEFQIQNPGTDVLTVSSITFDDAAYSVDMTSFSVPARGSQSVTVTFAPGAVASYPASMTVQSDDPDEPSVNVPLNGQGVVPPDFAVAPTSLSSDLFSGESETQALTLTNAGGADLEYSLSVDLGSQVTVYNVPDLGKGEVDPNPGILGNGGPDNFGYSWIDSDDPGGPVFDWVDISGVGTPIYSGNADDSNRGPFPIGFDFPFYGNNFSTFRTSSNGFISFTSTSSDLSNAPLPGTGAPENLLAIYHDDMYVDADIPSQVYYYNDGSRLIVQFDQIRKFSQSDTSPPFYTFQAILYPNGAIVYQYLTVGTVNNSATVGIQNATRDDGLTLGYNVEYAHDGLAVRFAAAAEWLAAAPASGVIPPGGSAQVNVTFDAADLFGGLYEGAVMITTNDPLAPMVNVPCDLAVTGAPNLSLDPASIDFGDVFVGYPDLHQFTIFNSGTDQLTITGITSDNPVFSVSLGGGTFPINLAPLASTSLQARFEPPSPGPFSGTLAVASNDPDGTGSTIALSGTGLVAPVAGAPPTSLDSDLLTGEAVVQTVPLSNTGGSDLSFQVSVDLGTQVTIYETPDLGKGVEDFNPGILGSGGPDVFGYSWTDSDEPGGPVFDWTDISGVGTPMFAGNSDDGNQGPFPIGFNFPFYGNSFSEFRACSNGFLSFTSSSGDFSNAPLPGTGAPENLLAVYHDDMYVDADIPSQVYYYNDGVRLIVQWDSIRRLGQSDSSPPFYTFQAILYPNGTIVYQYLTVGVTNNSATVGIQNASRDDGLTIAYNAEYAHDGLAIRIAAIPDWITATPASGVVPPGGSLPIAVTVNASGLFGGTYDGAVLINTNDPANGLITLPVHLNVTGVPRIGFDPASLAFGDIFLGYPSDMLLTVTNVGTDLLSIASIGSGLADYTVDPSSFDLDPLASQVVTVTFDPQAVGDRSTDLTFMSNDPDSPHMVPVSGTGVEPPVIGVSPALVEGAALPGGSKVKTLTVCNTGGSDLVWTAGATAYGSASVQVHSYLEGPKGTDEVGGEAPADPRPSILGSGGPDLFGYSWTDSDEPGGPTYDWTDLTGIGTPVGFDPYEDDGTVGPVPIGFDFPFYGNSFSSLNVCSNGWASFTSMLHGYSNQPLPNSGSAVPENLLAPWWDDMVYDETDLSEVLYYNDGGRFILQYYIRRIGDFTPPHYRFQVILYPNGDIVYQYHTLGSTISSATIGMQNATKDDGLTVSFNDGSYPHEGLAIRFSTAAPWLSVSPESGVVPAGECVDLSVTMDAAALEAGDYFGNITLMSNDPASPSVASEVAFHVGSIDVADADIDPNTLNLGANGKFVFAQIELPTGYDPADIVPETVRLNGSVPVVGNSPLGDFNSNGIPDRQFKFNRSEVDGSLEEGDSVMVTVTGEIEDTIYFTAMEIIRVIRPQMQAPSAGATLTAGSTYMISWTNPQGYVVDHATLTYSPDDGATWSLIADDVIGTSYAWSVPPEPTQTGRVRVYVSDNKGIMGYDTSDPFMIAAAVIGAENVTPTVYALRQNAPNPFRGATRIAFDLPEAADVELRIYDVSGRMVRSLDEGRLPAGRYEALWDGRDTGGREVASGIYFYRLESAAYSATKRMFLMK